jgi:hypothetical protein
MPYSKLVRSAVLSGLLVSLSVPTLAQEVMQRSSDTPSVRNAEKPRTTEAQKAPVSAMDPVLLNPQPLPPTPPDPIQQVTPRVSTLPDNFFELNDRAIIVVGGKQMQAGQVKREISTELERLSGPPVTTRSVARTELEARALVPTPTVPAVTPKATQPVPEVQPPTRAPRMGRNAPVTAGPAGATASQGPSVVQTTVTAADAIEFCTKNPARIVRVTGPLQPKQPFTIQGECFGDRSGAVEVAGLPGKVDFREWSNHRIVAVLPAVRGHADKPVNLTVVRADKARSAPAQADFIALRERVEVPVSKWTPNGQVRRQFASAATGGTFIESNWDPGGERFRLEVNRGCALIDAAWTQRVGKVTAFTGWENGPPHAADVSIQWAPLCVRRTTDFGFNLARSEICEIAFDLKAWAHCPLGVAP